MFFHRKKGGQGSEVIFVTVICQQISAASKQIRVLLVSKFDAFTAFPSQPKRTVIGF